MVRIIKRNAVDLEDSYRNIISKTLWVAFGLVILLQILALKPLCLFGYKYYYIPIIFAVIPLIFIYYLVTKNLTEPLAKASPPIYLSALLSCTVLLGTFTHYSMKNVNEEINYSETRAKNHLVELATFLHQFALELKQEDNENINYNNDLNDEEFLPELPEKFRNHLNWVKFNQEAITTHPPIEGYYFYYRSTNFGSWHLWCTPDDYPDSGRLSWLIDNNGKLLGRDFEDEKINVKQFPSHKRDLNNYSHSSRITFKNQLENEGDF